MEKFSSSSEVSYCYSLFIIQANSQSWW